ncbi:molybdopterin-synthase adenylyltransferase MoeB [soil metagenome]
MFSKDQLDRYARHIILPGVGAAGQRKLLDAKVLVVGAGGLGSPVLLYLAAAGVGTLGVVDFDTVETSNLQRQIIHDSDHLGSLKTASAQRRITALNPDVWVETYPERLSSENALELFALYDLIIDGSDNFATRYLVNDACVLTGTPLLYGAMSQFEGQLSLFHAATPAGMSPCYRCLFPTPPEPGTVPNCAEAGVFGALPGVVGSLLAVEAIKVLLNLGESLAGTLLHYDALYSETRRISVTRNPDCAVCGDAPSVTALVDYEAFCGRA